MTDHTQFLDLLVDWQEQYDRGLDPGPEELCPLDEAHQSELRRRIAKRKKLFALLSLSPACGAVVSPSTLAVPGFSGL
jgi:hypothetical protein